jgi:hypothetical protein
MSVFRIRSSLCLLALLASSALPAVAQQQGADDNAGPRSIAALRITGDERPRLDGRLDEPFWQRAQPAADFIQVDPTNGAPATEPTEVRIVFDRDTIYMGVTCFDSDPDGWLGYERRRDGFLPADDRFMWTIDTYLDARSGYFFEMNPSGLMADSWFGVNGDNRAWDGIWNARVHRSAIGWTIEIAIPFRTLNFDPDSDAWGFNFQRTVRRKNEDSIWMGWARNQGLRRMTNAGRVTGIRDVSQGRGLDVKPYALLTSVAQPGHGVATDSDGDAGLDVFYNPTPSMRANLTINTDFAQTEVDQRQVNLTRFNLFFPERREFFLDGATFFDFGSSAGSNDLLVNPFFSRRIGLSADATPQPIDVGTKVTGQLGGQDVGLLHVRSGTGDDHEFVGEDFTVARVKRRVFQQSYIGALYTRRAARDTGAGASHTAGVDFRLATSRFLGNQNLNATGWLLHTSGPAVDGAGAGRSNAFGVFVEYPNDRWSARVGAREVQANFDPEVGFVTRRDYRRYQPGLTFAPRPQGHRYVRRLEFSANADVLTSTTNHLLERSLSVTLLGVELHSQDSFGIELNPTHERLDAPFTIAPGIVLPLGAQYTYTRVALRGQTANRRVLAINGRYETGGFYSGDRRQVVAQLNVRARPGYLVYLNGEWNQVNLREGRFASNLYRVIGETQFTPFVALVNTLQFDTVSRVAGLQSRFRWIVTPGNDIYLVYNHNWLEDPILDRFAIQDRRFASKLLYTHRF